MKGADAPPQALSKPPKAVSDPTRNSFNPTAADLNAPLPATVPTSTNNSSAVPAAVDQNLSANGTAPPATPPTSNAPDAAPSNNARPAMSIPVVPAPEQTANSTCRNSSTGKNVTFSDRACWHAAKVLAEAGSSYAQCGSCVLGLFDADKKAAFKPPSAIPAAIIQEQAMRLLQQCKSDSPKVSKRDTTPAPPSNDTANVQLLMGYNEKAKECPGL